MFAVFFSLDIVETAFGAGGLSQIATETSPKHENQICRNVICVWQLRLIIACLNLREAGRQMYYGAHSNQRIHCSKSYGCITSSYLPAKKHQNRSLKLVVFWCVSAIHKLPKILSSNSSLIQAFFIGWSIWNWTATNLPRGKYWQSKTALAQTESMSLDWPILNHYCDLIKSIRFCQTINSVYLIMGLTSIHSYFYLQTHVFNSTIFNRKSWKGSRWYRDDVIKRQNFIFSTEKIWMPVSPLLIRDNVTSECGGLYA